MISRLNPRKLMAAKEGVAMIEFAIIAPIMILIMVAAMEYGLYFMKSLSASRALGVAAQAVAANPSDITGNQAIANSNAGFGEYSACAASFETASDAVDGNCGAGLWQTLPPSPTHTGSYFVKMIATGSPGSVTTLFDPYIPDIEEHQVVKVEMCGEDFTKVADDTGALVCARSHINQTCSGNDIVVGHDANGFAICGQPLAGQSCGSGRMMVGFSSSGNIQCDDVPDPPEQCPSGTSMVCCRDEEGLLSCNCRNEGC